MVIGVRSDSASRRLAAAALAGSIRVPFVVVICVAALLVGAATGWALMTVFHPPPDQSAQTATLFATVTRGSVGGSIDVEASATWRSGFTARNQAAGTVTSATMSADAPAEPGTVLYTVDLRPVVVAQGTVPSFRDLTAGMTGPDVSQLQSLLHATGQYTGVADGRFTGALQRAVIAWHRALGLGADSTVERGDIVYVPSLPARVSLSASLVGTGDTVSGGEAAVRVLAASPDFSLVLTTSQAGLIPPGARVTLHPTGGHKWAAKIGAVVSNANGVTISLKPLGSSPICSDSCSAIGASGTSLIPASVTTTPTVTGLTIPTAAIQTDALNRTFVEDPKGIDHRVRVLGSSDGISVVTGITAGMRVRVPTLSGEQ
jgi:peptidoglycan hydrolase-like protein with peptidoglycan-binding domain